MAPLLSALLLLCPVGALAEDTPGATVLDEVETAPPAEPGEVLGEGVDAAEPHDVGGPLFEEPTVSDVLETDAVPEEAVDESMIGSLSPAPVDPEQRPGLDFERGEAPQLRVKLNADGSRYLRFAAWLQVWIRAMQMNPGTTVLEEPTEWYGDIAIRRARFLMFGSILPRVSLMLHFGINNQSFVNARKPQLFFHDLWVEVEAYENFISVGGGLIYWNGISRMTNASTVSLLTLDAPIVNWPTIDETDQFGRQLGIYAKGQVKRFDYRVALTRPFSTDVVLIPGGPADFNDRANSFAYQGYFQYMFRDIESNVLPYTVGTHLGTARVANLGTGFHVHPQGVANLSTSGELNPRTLVALGADLFLDRPLAGRRYMGALTFYGVYYYLNFGPDYLRNIGSINPGDPGSGTSRNGPGNAYPVIGTGHSFYSNLGWLLPVTARILEFQPFAAIQLSAFEALADPMAFFALGANVFIHDHNAKLTLQYQNRPVFDIGAGEDSTVVDRASEILLQVQLFI